MRNSEVLAALPFILLWICALAFHIWIAFDLFGRREETFLQVGHNRSTWVVLWWIGWCVFGVVIDLVYLLRIRPALVRAEADLGGPPPPTDP